MVFAGTDVSTPHRNPARSADRKEERDYQAGKSAGRGLPAVGVVQLAEARGYCELYPAEPRIFQRMAPVGNREAVCAAGLS